MKFSIVILLIFIFCPIIGLARTYKLEGMVGGQYPIVIELEEDNRGLFSGRYAYKSTLQKNGYVDCSWLDITPSYENPATCWDVRDCKLEPVETWSNVRFTDGKRLTCRMKNVQGKVYDIVATVTASSNDSPSTISYFKEHLGECASEFGLFSDPSIVDRFEEMMGANNFNYLTAIYQTQGPIEYRGGMYHASGFMAHQCCDPAAVWAYDAYTDTFYVWIRKDDQNYWWSESGEVPYKFGELVDATF